MAQFSTYQKNAHNVYFDISVATEIFEKMTKSEPKKWPKKDQISRKKWPKNDQISNLKKIKTKKWPLNMSDFFTFKLKNSFIISYLDEKSQPALKKYSIFSPFKLNFRLIVVVCNEITILIRKSRMGENFLDRF